MFKRLFTAAMLFGVACTAPPVSAQTFACAPRDTIIERLAERFSEHLVAGGLQDSKSIIELWASDTTGTFTVLVSRADGLSCVISSGTNFHQNAPDLVRMGTPS